MASISVLRALPPTQVTLPIEPAPAVAGVFGSGDTQGSLAENRKSLAVHDQALLSATGTILAHALSLSDVRYEKIAAIQQAIAAGTYHVSASALASQLIESLAV